MFSIKTGRVSVLTGALMIILGNDAAMIRLRLLGMLIPLGPPKRR